MTPPLAIGLDVRAIGPHFPGIGRATLGLLRGLHGTENDASIAVFYDPARGDELAAVGAGNDARFRLVAAPAPPQGLTQQWRIPRSARGLGLSVWHAPYYFRPFWGLPSTVVTIGDVIGPAGDNAGGALPQLDRVRRRTVWRIAMRLSVRTAAHVITYSRSARHDLQCAYRLADSSVSVVPLAADPQFRPQAATEVRRVREQYALPGSYVLYVGSNKPHKNLEALVDAWSLVVRSGDAGRGNDGLSLVVAGRQDPRYPAARRKSASLGLDERVRFLADVPDARLPALMSGAALFVFPSLHEGFGLPPLEAMACGTPVLASNRTSLPEVVGDAGLLVEPEPAALAEGMRRLLADDELRRELCERGLQRAALFSWERVAAETLQVYRQVASSRGDGG